MADLLYSLRSRLPAQKAQGLVEYALILAFVVSVFILISVTNPQLKQSIAGAFDHAATAVDTVSAGG